jgi:hypothetical protein
MGKEVRSVRGAYVIIVWACEPTACPHSLAFSAHRNFLLQFLPISLYSKIHYGMDANYKERRWQSLDRSIPTEMVQALSYSVCTVATSIKLLRMYSTVGNALYLSRET